MFLAKLVLKVAQLKGIGLSGIKSRIQDLAKQELEKHHLTI